MLAKDSRRRYGDRGEAQARAHLEARGFIWLESNWHCRAGEIDIVMTDGPCLVFVEVKARRSERAGRAEEAVSASKVRKLLNSAEWYIAEHPEAQDQVWRCDLVAIQSGEAGVPTLVHYENALVAG